MGVERGGGAEPSALAPKSPPPEPVPPAVPITEVLPSGAGIVYASPAGLWALDRESGARQLVAAQGVNSPVISADREWIAYWIVTPDQSELWAIRWNGQDAHLLLTEQDLPTEDLSEDYSGRRFQDVGWVPSRDVLAVITVAIPVTSDAKLELTLWNLNVKTGKLHYVLNMGQAQRPVYAPDGTRFALLRQGTGQNPTGSISLYNADGTGARTILGFPADATHHGYEARLSWLPDGSALWAAIPDADLDQVQHFNGITLCQIPIEGTARSVNHIDAFDAFWSPEGTRLAYTQVISESVASRALFLADADGTNAQPYATLRQGGFVNWSPDSAHFLYQNDGQVYLGAPGQPPRRLGNAVSVFDPHWITPKQIIHLLDQGTSWVLVSQTVDGQVVSLVSLPKDITYDIR